MLNAMMFETEMERLGITVLYAKEEFGNNAAGRFALRTMMNVNRFYSEMNSQNFDVTREQVLAWLNSFKNGSLDDKEYQSHLLKHFYARLMCSTTVASN